MKRPVNRYSYYLAKRLLEFSLTRSIAVRLTQSQMESHIAATDKKLASRFKETIFNEKDFCISDKMRDCFVQHITCVGPFKNWTSFELDLLKRKGHKLGERFIGKDFVSDENLGKMLFQVEATFLEYYWRYFRTHDQKGNKVRGIIEDHSEYLIRYANSNDLVLIDAILDKSRPDRSNAYSQTKNWVDRFPFISILRIGNSGKYEAVMSILPVTDECYNKLKLHQMAENDIGYKDIVHHTKKLEVSKFFVYEYVTGENKFLFDILKNLRVILNELCDLSRSEIMLSVFARTEVNHWTIRALGFKAIGQAHPGDGGGFSVVYEINIHDLLVAIPIQMATHTNKTIG